MKAMPWCACLLAAIVTAASVRPASADLFWQGTGNWSGSAWATTSGGPYTGAWTAGSNAQFETTAGTITVNAPASVGNMTFNVGQTVDGTSALTLVGTTATVQAGISAQISAPLAGDTLTKVGTGTLVLSGDNTHSGLTTVSAGVLSVRSNTALGATSAGTTVAAGTSLHLQEGITVAGESLSLVGDGIHYANEPGALRNISGNNAWTGNITIGNAATRIVADAGSLTIDGNISLTGSATNHLILQGDGNILVNGNISGGGSASQTLTRSGVGSGVMTLAGTNTYQGVTTISGGTLQVGNGGSTGTLGAGNVVNNSKLVVDRTGEITLNQVISGSGTLTKKGAGTLTLSGGNSYGGATTVSAGVLKISHNTALGTGAAGTSVTSGAGLQLSGGIVVVGEALTLAGTGISGSGALQNVSGNNEWAGPVATTGGQVNIHSDAGLLELSGPITLHDLQMQYNLVLVPRGGNILVSGNITGGVDGALLDRRSVTMGSASTGVATLSGANTYLGRTSINGGTLRVEGGAAIPDYSPVFFYSNGAVLELGGNETVGYLSTGAGITTAKIKLGANTLTVGAADNGSEVIFAGTIEGTGGVTKTGTGVQRLSGVNTYEGTTTINAGTLAVAGGSAIPDGSRVDFSSASGTQTLELLGGETIGSLSSVGTNARVVLNAHTLTIADGDGQNFQGSISGAGGVTKTGLGLQVFSGANTYDGLTRVSGGTLRVDGGAAIPDASRVLFSGSATLELFHDETVGSLSSLAGTTVKLNAHTLTVGADNSPSLQDFTGAITGGGGLTKVGTGIQALTGANTYTGDTIIEQGILHIGSWGSIHADSAIKVGEDGTHRVVVLANGGGASAGSRRSQLTSSATNAIELPAAITAVASTATSLVDMTWRPRTTVEEALHLSSDVLTLSNTFATTVDAFVLQMAYDRTLPWLAGGESALIDTGLIFLASDASGWENAVFSNTAGSPLWMGDTAAPATDLASKLGWYGVDTSGDSHVAWAVLDYGGSFAVTIPEPSAFALLAAGLLVLAWPRRKRT